ncbi:Outer membrane efflux protein [Desulforamulus putei DSM 12395]|uniref:Outer membrane efflux protein n=1 Tax=Desulforamulus putei DSM 12395 TaxID=1121429 RepID=A0A1M4XT68_9FIRM|nr:TolC family protein [Desulforamulus putei]SHE96473.1 Outer membrane efflux protein [Desulforamulus putei DSM 12395]
MRRIILISLLVISLIFTNNAFAIDKYTINLSIEQVIAMAKANSLELAKKKAVLEQKEESRKDAYSVVEYLPTSPYYVREISGAYSQYIGADFNQRLAQKNKDFSNIVVTVDAKNKFYDVLNKKASLRLKELEYQKAQISLSQILAKKEVGMATELHEFQARTELAAAQTALKNAEAALEKAYYELNDLIGIPRESRPELLEPTGYDKIKVESMQAEINKVMLERPDAFAAKELVTVKAKLKEHASNYKIGELEESIAKLDYKDTKDKVERDVHSMYNDIVNLEKLIETQEESVKACKEALRNMVVQYELGMVTRLEVLSSETKLKEAENSLKQSLYKHDVAMSSFPYLAGMSSNSGTVNNTISASE